MAKTRKDQNSTGKYSTQGTSANTSSFTKGLVRDFDENFDPESSWPYARNASNNSIEGDVGLLGNEPANYPCGSAPYIIIGRINLYEQYWAIFSTDDTNSEIGLYDESQCTYRTIVNDPCLDFSTLHLVTGVAKENFDCSWGVYFADGKNLDRFLNIGIPDLWPTVPYIGNNYYQNETLWPGVQWQQDCKSFGGCTICTNKNLLDCDLIRINPLVKTPCIKLEQGLSGGNLLNGSYMAFVAYTINGIKYGDYFSPSNVQYIFDHDVVGGSLEVTISNLELESFKEFELVIVSIVNSATVARRIGIYTCAPTVTVTLDYIDDSLVTVPLEQLPIRTPLYETSDSIFETGSYLLKIGPRTTYDFNYQPLANQIVAKWVATRYPADYYKNGGYVTGYMRDEVYSFWIRWIYSTGQKSKSYHIPGRYFTGDELDLSGNTIYSDPGERVFEVKNTATGSAILPANQQTVEDGGVTIAEGLMGYWESTEKYPDAKPEIWNATEDPTLSGTSDPKYDLCNKPIRHHKMPEDIVGSATSFTRASTTATCEAQYINILGVKFENIKPPVYKDENGNIKVIPGIVGYEILRGSRQGNKSILAKGIINNMRTYKTALDGENEVSGLYPNYPYNPVRNTFFPEEGDNYLDPTLSKTQVLPDGSNWAKVTQNDVSRNYFTFHSPDTSFYKPYLSAKELRLYTEVGCPNNVEGNFQRVPGHPKQKLLTDLSLITALIIGIAEGIVGIKGTSSVTIENAKVFNAGLTGTGSTSAPGINPSAASTTAANVTQTTAAATANSTGVSQGAAISGFGNTSANIALTAITGYDPNLFGAIGSGKVLSFNNAAFVELPAPLRVAGGVISFLNLTSIATNANLKLITSLVKWRDYAVSYISHGFLHKDNRGNVQDGTNKRSLILESGYIRNQFTVFDNKRINNLYRSSTVALKINTPISDPLITDNTVNSIGTNHTNGYIEWPNPAGGTEAERSQERPFKPFRTTASCYYAGMKIRYRNQYGQLDSIEQVMIPCRQIVNDNKPIPNSTVAVINGTTVFNTTYTSDVLFGGDIYISRYTEKNTFFYFYDWLFGEPDGTSFNYYESFLALYPRYWAIFEDYDIGGFLSSVLSNLFSPENWYTPANNNNLDGVKEANAHDAIGIGNDDENGGTESAVGNSLLTSLAFGRKNAYFYLFQSGVRDFYVESEVNIAQRDWGEKDEEKHYEILSNLRELFFTSIIKSGNYFKIDPSVSLYRLFFNVISWGNMQDRDYNPVVAELCYRYLANRVIYSLPNTLESNKDGWRVFLPNNYKDFRSQVTAIRPIGKNGAIIFFMHDSPQQIQGTETLDTDIGTKLTIGDGALFNQPIQAVINTDNSFEYGSCQDKFSIINSPLGIYWISQSQGKVFTMSGGINEISAKGMRWWFGKFLPFRILEDFPDFEVIDNPVAGVGCQSIFDNDFQMIYFCKKDYQLRKDLPEGTTVTYVSGVTFLVNGVLKVKLGDPTYFKDVSWTISYDPKVESWISFHDWHPDLTILSSLNFISTKGSTMWRHNDSTDSYCNYYGFDYPFQVEYVLDSGQTVNTLRNIEYILESYVYDEDGIDRFQLLDFNYDELVVYNSEQVSGLLRLNEAPKENPFARLNYPQVNPANIDIIFEKVEQKFRVNQFWDITADRGEYNVNVQRPIWLTEWDGYKRELNPANLNYNKSVFERKKFRHYYMNVLFTRNVSGNVKMLMKISNNKTLYSPR